jgi:hypothetical protein
MHYYDVQRSSIATTEVQEGIALFVDPEVIKGSFGFSGLLDPDPTLEDGRLGAILAAGDRYFAVVWRDGDAVLIAPLYSQCRAGRLPVGAKVGHPSWVDHPTFYDPRQVWVATVDALVEAAAKGGDLSSPRRRNRVDSEGLESMRLAIRTVSNAHAIARKEGSHEAQRVA